jgi:hypothetical protein
MPWHVDKDRKNHLDHGMWLFNMEVEFRSINLHIIIDNWLLMDN